MPRLIAVRSACPTDAPAIVDFQIAMALETEGLRLDPDTVTAGVAAVFADDHKGRYLVAEMDCRVVGTLLLIPEWSDWRCGTVLWLHSVYVLPEHRRQGVFHELFAHVKAEVDASPEIRGLRLYVEKGNRRAQSAYRQVGMRADHYDLYEWLK